MANPHIMADDKLEIIHTLMDDEDLELYRERKEAEAAAENKEKDDA